MTTTTTNSRTGETTITNDTTGNFVVYGPDVDGGYNLAGYSADGDGPHWQDFTETEDEAVATAERMLA